MHLYCVHNVHYCALVGVVVCFSVLIASIIHVLCIIVHILWVVLPYHYYNVLVLIARTIHSSNPRYYSGLY